MTILNAFQETFLCDVPTKNIQRAGEAAPGRVVGGRASLPQGPRMDGVVCHRRKEEPLPETLGWGARPQEEWRGPAAPQKTVGRKKTGSSAPQPPSAHPRPYPIQPVCHPSLQMEKHRCTDSLVIRPRSEPGPGHGKPPQLPAVCMPAHWPRWAEPPNASRRQGTQSQGVGARGWGKASWA